MSIEAMRKALNYIENTESELGIKLAAAIAPQVSGVPRSEMLEGVEDIIRDKVYADENDKVGGVYDAAQKVIEYITTLAAQPPAAPVEQPAWENLTAIIRPMIESVCSDGNSDAARLAKDIADRIIASCSLTRPAQPVAWRVLNDFGHWYITQDKALADTYRDIEKKDVQPLYLAKSKREET